MIFWSQSSFLVEKHGRNEFSAIPNLENDNFANYFAFFGNFDLLKYSKLSRVKNYAV